MHLPSATIRTQVSVPLRFADGYSHGGSGVQLRGARRRPRALDVRARRLRGFRWCGCTASASPATCSAVNAATAGLSYAKPSSGSPTRWLSAVPAGREGRGIGLYAKLEAYALQDIGLDTYDANLALGHREDERSYVAAAQMLQALGVSRVALLSNNPDKARQLHRCGVSVAERVPTGVHLSPANGRYLATKARRGAHTFDVGLPATLRASPGP